MKILMAVIQELGGNIAASDLYALLFLYCHEFIENNHYYNFIPQNEGPVSLQAEADKKVLIGKKCLENNANWIAIDGIERFAVPLDFFEKIAVQKLKNKWHGKNGEELQDYLKQNYPDYFNIPSQESAVEQSTVFYTIGYEGLSPESYLNKLLDNNVKLLCDVRKNAFSQKYGFSKNELKESLAKVGVEYIHIPDLGIVSDERQSLNTDKDYRDLFEKYDRDVLPLQQNKLDLLTKLLKENKRIAITCFEAKVCHCHRGRITKALQNRPDFEYKIEHL